jgi:hypothetical protein
MKTSTNTVTTTEVKIQQDEFFQIIKDYLESKGVENTDKHVVIDVDKEVINGYDEILLNITIKTYSNEK